MNITYNGVSLSALGEVTIRQSAEYSGGDDGPIRKRHSLQLTIAVFERQWSDNRALLEEGIGAVNFQHGVLTMTDPDSGKDYVRTTATVKSHDFPETWGTYHQELNVVFEYVENDVASNVAVGTITGSSRTVTLGTVLLWKEGEDTSRFNPLRPHREKVGGRVTASGVILGNMAADLATRRADLLARKTELVAAARGKEVTLVFADFNRLVRVEGFEAELDQHTHEIKWTLSASYVLFPTEASYAMAQFTAEQRDPQTGELFLNVSGRVQAQSEAAARSKLSFMMASVLLSTGFSLGQQLNDGTTAETIDAGVDGATFTQLNFALEFRKWATTNQLAFFTNSGTGAARVALPNVKGTTYRYSAKRFHELRTQRSFAGNTVTLSGTIAVAQAVALADRRTILLAKQKEMRLACNGADGLLEYADLSQRIKVTDFSAEINQAVTGIEWSLTGDFTVFPNEGGYALVDYSVALRESPEEGDSFLSFSGRIGALNESAAYSKLEVLRTAVLNTYAYPVANRTRKEGVTNNISADSDGDAFTELTFAEEYRRRMASVEASTLKVSERADVKAGMVSVVYTGTVVASGASVAAAYAAALAKAQSLGDNKLSFQTGSTVTWTMRQVSAAAAQEFVNLEFSYEYQRAAGPERVYCEFTTQRARETFGLDSISVSGFVGAGRVQDLDPAYRLLVRQGYAGQLIRNESISNPVMAQIGAASPGGAEQQQFRMEFSFSVHQAKGDKSAIRYEIETQRNFLTREIATRLHGSVFALNETVAAAALEGLLSALSLGSRIGSTQLVARERVEAGALGDNLSGIEQFIRFDFDEAFANKLDATSEILECEVAEQLTYSAARWVEQPLPRNGSGTGGVSVMQDCGLLPGRRTVRGMVKAATEATALAAVAKYRDMLTGDADEGHYPLPEERETTFSFVPLTDGIPRETLGTENVRVASVAFTYGEILPNYPVDTLVVSPRKKSVLLSQSSQVLTQGNGVPDSSVKTAFYAQRDVSPNLLWLNMSGTFLPIMDIMGT